MPAASCRRPRGGPGRLACLALSALLLGCRGPATENPAEPASGGVRFEEVGERAGLDFRWPALPRPLTIRTSFGYGCGFLDYDRDGWLDVVLVGQPHCGLFRNRGDGTFADVTAETGLNAFRGAWHGLGTGDFDADGWPDLYLSGFGSGRLLRSERGRSFTDATRVLGPRDGGWESSAGFADLDGDGDLDLFVGRYVHFGPGSPVYCELAPGVRSGCPPARYPGERGRLYRNDGGRFTDVSRQAGVLAGQGKNLALSFADYDRDGRLDFYVANDGTAGNLFRNLGGLRFKDVGLQTGCALNADGQSQAGMGAAWADYNRDGWQDLIVTTFSSEEYSLYRNSGGFFDAVSRSAGVAAPTRNALGFGVQWIDADNDGWPDLVFGNGHVYDNTDRIEPGTTFRQPLMLLMNQGGRRFVPVTSDAGPALADPIVARGLASGDYDRDGRVDLLVVDLEGRPRLLRNTSGTRNRWLRVRLEGPSGNPDGEGAVVTIRTPGGEQQRTVTAAGSYLSINERAAHFGLGPGEEAVQVTVRWPDGFLQSASPPRADAEMVVRRD